MSPQTPPTEWHGRTLVVFEGVRRMLWNRPSPGVWRPAGIWPGPAAAASLAGHLDVGGSTLVVLNLRPATVGMLEEEWAQAPASVRRLAPPPGPGAREPFDVRIPVLDWLPELARLRGTELLRAAADLADRTPAALLPPVIVDPVGPVGPVGSVAPNLRFTVLTRRDTLAGAPLSELVSHLFAPVPQYA